VELEADRQRVLIQITQNLATRIRNSHAFNLPTLYLPHDDGPPCSIRAWVQPCGLSGCCCVGVGSVEMRGEGGRESEG